VTANSSFEFGRLVERAAALVDDGERRILGIAGPPGSGKSTLAEALVRALGPRAVLVPMDGFHLAESELARLGRGERKGATDTFDAAGYIALLRRLRDQVDDIVYSPEFRREIEEPVACAIPVPRETPLVVTEGNYLLVQDEPWAAVVGLLDDSWYLDLDEDTRLERLVARHVVYGKDLATAISRSVGSDQRNAAVVSATREHAGLVVRVAESGDPRSASR
jgi:pantothenate kinase